jgi:DNA-binding SARP family transcriptional activator
MARLGAPRQQVVLAMLLLDANRVVPMERLIDAVWDDCPPTTARAQVQICVSAIRGALSDAGVRDTVVTRPPGYLLHVGEEELDSQVFDRLAAAAGAAAREGRLADAVADYRRALALWRGEPLAGLQSRVVQGAALQLGERALTAVEECLEAELRLGRHRDVVAEATRLVAEYPLRERFRAQLMLALHRSGRTHEALAAYRRAREEFVQELGVEPGAELRRLERGLLHGDPALDPPAVEAPAPIPAALDPGRAPASRTLPADVADFTGREELVEELRVVITTPAGAEGGAGPLVAITGGGGTGKGTLAVHLAHLVRKRFPDGQLYLSMRQAEGGPIRAAEALRRLLRMLDPAGAAAPESADELAERYRGLLANRRVLVVLDDAEDEEQVLPLLPANPQCAVVVTSRYRLTGLPSAHHADLNPLSERQAVHLLSRVVGPERVDSEPEAARAVANLCGRLPLAIRIGAARLAARPHWPISRLAARLRPERRRLDELTHHGLAVRPNIAAGYSRLVPDAQVVFRRLGILQAPDFAAWVAAPLLDAHLPEAEELLESIVDVRLLEVDPSAAGPRYRFHDLIRAFARERLGAEPQADGREALRRSLAAWLVLAGRARARLCGDEAVEPGEEAQRWGLSGPVVDQLVRDPLAWYEVEHGALAAITRQAAEAGLHDLGHRLRATLIPFQSLEGGPKPDR